MFPKSSFTGRPCVSRQLASVNAVGKPSQLLVACQELSPGIPGIAEQEWSMFIWCCVKSLGWASRRSYLDGNVSKSGRGPHLGVTELVDSMWKAGPFTSTPSYLIAVVNFSVNTSHYGQLFNVDSWKLHPTNLIHVFGLGPRNLHCNKLLLDCVLRRLDSHLERLGKKVNNQWPYNPQIQTRGAPALWAVV